MSKSNPVHPWRLGRTRALIFTQKSLNRAKTGVPHGTPKNFPRLGRDVSTMRKTQSTKINRKINFILHGLATRRLSVKKKVTRNSHFSRPAETDPYMDSNKLFGELEEKRLDKSSAPIRTTRTLGHIKKTLYSWNIAHFTPEILWTQSSFLVGSKETG